MYSLSSHNVSDYLLIKIPHLSLKYFIQTFINSPNRYSSTIFLKLVNTKSTRLNHVMKNRQKCILNIKVKSLLADKLSLNIQ